MHASTMLPRNFRDWIAQATEQLLILLVDSVLLFLNGLYDFGLGLLVVWSSIAVTWDVCGWVLSCPIHSSHVKPGLWLRFHTNCWSLYLIDIGCTTDV